MLFMSVAHLGLSPIEMLWAIVKRILQSKFKLSNLIEVKLLKQMVLRKHTVPKFTNFVGQ